MALNKFTCKTFRSAVDLAEWVRDNSADIHALFTITTDNNGNHILYFEAK